ncbi:MAG: bacteriohemerythrin [Nitrospinota bacterium]|nr:bacteriohemerythrin [Nitrospinota bacterium]
MLIEWNNRFSVDIPKYDSQHLRLFFIINNLHDAMEKGLGQAALRNILDELVEYTLIHFQEEEMSMADCRYPGLATHVQEHKKLQAEVNNFINDLNSGKSVVTGEVLGFLVKWLKDHIVQSDKKYSPFLKKHDAQKALNSVSFQKKI